MNEDQIIAEIIQREGGFSDRTADRGGATNFGITIQTLAAWRKKPVTVDDVKKLTPAEATEIYRARYVRDPGFDKIADLKLRALLVDSFVQHWDDAIKWLQRAVGTKADGILGPATLDALGHHDLRKVYLAICAQRTRYYGQLLRNPAQSPNAGGWTNRVAGFIETAPI